LQDKYASSRKAAKNAKKDKNVGEKTEGKRQGPATQPAPARAGSDGGRQTLNVEYVTPRTGKRSPDLKAPRTSEDERGQDEDE
jgi:hypothetical protein